MLIARVNPRGRSQSFGRSPATMSQMHLSSRLENTLIAHLDPEVMALSPPPPTGELILPNRKSIAEERPRLKNAWMIMKYNTSAKVSRENVPLPQLVHLVSVCKGDIVEGYNGPFVVPDSMSI